MSSGTWVRLMARPATTNWSLVASVGRSDGLGMRPGDTVFTVIPWEGLLYYGAASLDGCWEE